MTIDTRGIMPAAAWREAAEAHETRADALTAAHRDRSARGEKHPVWDFLFTYYSYKPAVLRRWHPGPDVVLADAIDDVRSGWRGYTGGPIPRSLVVDVDGLERGHGALFERIEVILAGTAARPGRFDCFGLHEWAMVYRQDSHRHPVPLRLGQDGTDDVVDDHDLRCTHYDAFRFFTDAAVPRNATLPTRDAQPRDEQPGCLHAGMDVYKWAIKLGPIVPGPLLLDAFELARDIRRLDMEASPYELRDWGFSPVRIETPEGKAEYVRRQRMLAERSNALRRAILEAWRGDAPATQVA